MEKENKNISKCFAKMSPYVIFLDSKLLDRESSPKKESGLFNPRDVTPQTSAAFKPCTFYQDNS